MSSLVPNVYAAIFTPVPLATLALALRLKARRMTRMGMGYDDVLAVAAWVLAIGYTVDLIVWASCFKLGQKLGSYSDQKIDYIMEKSYLVLWVSELLYAWSIFFAKLAVLFFYRRLFQFAIRLPVAIVIGTCTIWIVIRTFFTIFHCLPVQAYWDKSIENAKCLTNVRAFYLGTDITHCSLDFIILGLPIYEVVKMQLPFGQKIAVVGLFAAGSLVGIASIFQIVHSQQYNSASNELPYDLALSMVWGNVELHLAVFIGSLTLLRPIFRKFIPGLHSATSRNASYPSRASNGFLQTADLRRTTSPRELPRWESVVLNGTSMTQHGLPEPKQNDSNVIRNSSHRRESCEESSPRLRDNESTYSDDILR